jgi:hypothetical protein
VVGVYLGHGGNPHTTAAISASWPYTGWAGMRDQCNDDDEYRELCRVMARHGIRVCTVVGGALAGSETLDRVLSAWDEVDREHPIRDMRWVLAHVARLDPQRDIPRVLRLGAVVTTQPASYLYRDGADALERGLDDVWMPFRTWTEAGIPWALSTDNKPYRMLFTLRTALARREMHGRVVGASQRLTFDQAIRAASASGAYVRGDDADTGALTPGRLADLVVLPVRDEADVGDADADLTMIGGEFLHPPRPR